MDKPAVKPAFAAVVLAAVTLGSSEFLGPAGRSGLVWAQEKQAEEKKEEEETGLGFTYRQRHTQTQPGIPKPIRFMAVIRESPQYGHRMDRYDRGKVAGSTCVNYADGTTISLFHRHKMYIRRSRPEGSPVPKQTADPRVQIKNALAGEHKKLGRRTIGGVEAEGIEVRNVRGSKANFKIDSAVRQFWSGVETGYPVLVQQTVVGNDGAIRIKTICDQFRWNVRFDPNEFTTKVPPDYQQLDVRQVQRGRGGFGAGTYGNTQ